MLMQQLRQGHVCWIKTLGIAKDLASTAVPTSGTHNSIGISEVQPAQAGAAFTTHHTRTQKADSAS